MSAAPAQGSRLERLFALLHSGPTEAARLAAARQLGEVQRQHPAELHRLRASLEDES